VERKFVALDNCINALANMSNTQYLFEDTLPAVLSVWAWNLKLNQEVWFIKSILKRTESLAPATHNKRSVSILLADL